MEKPMLIPLTKNKSAIVDSQDYKYLSKFKWHLHSNGYATRCICSKNNWRKREQVLMHRVILQRMGVNFEGKISDHINRNKLDNRRKNLRAVTPIESNFNRGNFLKSQNSGISWRDSNKKWRAYIQNKHLGYFENKLDAILARRMAEQKYYGSIVI